MRVFALARTAFFAAVFIWFWAWQIPRWFFGELHIVHPAGWIFVVLGFAITLFCMFEFAWRGRGTPAPFDPPRKLVVSGVYRYVRNPMYVGFVIALGGEAWLVARADIAYEILAFIAFVTLLVIAYEEPTLRRTFGDDYIEYCKHVSRWIPRLTPFDKPAAARVGSPHLE